MAQIYYTPPPIEAFSDMKNRCMELWMTMGNEGGYRDEKISRIEQIQNIGDNFMYMFSMFDHINQRKVANKLSAETKHEVRIRMIDGGNPDYFIDQVLGN